MEEILVLSNTLLIILAFFYFCQVKTEQKTKVKIHDLFLNYRPERYIRDQEFINSRFLLYVYPRTKSTDFSKRGLKNLEYCFAEVLINILDKYNNFHNNKNVYMCLKLKVKFHKYLKLYSNCFYKDNEIYLTLLGQRVIRNMCSCDLDLYNFYHFIYSILSKNNSIHYYFLQGIENYLHTDTELLTINHCDIKIDKNEIFNLYKYCFKNISDDTGRTHEDAF